ncbi:hypothetical protein [Glutamicibacter uratoxydans]|uniref:hypothetical protein n=1 Tax=Glutamicibacter uratoxydans TaxID=43667 RepID=UPI003D6DED4F
MSQRAPRRLPKTAAYNSQQLVSGATAAAVQPEPVAASEVPFVDSKRRMTLSLVPHSSSQRRRPLIVMIAVLVVLAFAVIVSLVLLNTSVAQRQYEMVSLRNQERVLSQENQTLLKEAQSLAAPQTLAKRAKELGLVAPAAPGLVDLQTDTITQSAEPATKLEGDRANYASLPLPGESIRSKASNDAESAKVAEANQKKAAEAKKQEAEQKVAESQKPKAETKEREVASDGRPVFDSEELNGGTIPAPSVKSPTN